MMPYPIQERIDWRRWVVPKGLRARPIHRWYVFPHSFTGELVHQLIDEWGLGRGDRILDPFVGAGTTVLAAKEKGIPATGYDLSPLAVLATRVKTYNYDAERLRKLWSYLRGQIAPTKWIEPERDYPHLVRSALPGALLKGFDSIDRAILRLEATDSERAFFRLALMTTIPEYSRAVATGGWLKWIDQQRPAPTLPEGFSAHVVQMLQDLASVQPSSETLWCAEIADARAVPDKDATYSAVITSPPYPNRHDYTRVFGVELMFGFLCWEETRKLRYQSFHSHPEAHPVRPEIGDYSPPTTLRLIAHQIGALEKDSRIVRMIDGYFYDLFIVLREISRVCKHGAHIAIVVGNAQYRGVSLPVDELTAEIGEQAGLKCDKLIIARYRGNSAQQMGQYGRRKSRESLIIFSKV